MTECFSIADRFRRCRGSRSVAVSGSVLSWRSFSWLAVVLLGLTGCNQAPPPPGSPWYYPGAEPRVGSTGSTGSTDAAYVADLQRRAEAQAQLAADEQLRLEQMLAQQKAADAELQAMKQQQQSAGQTAAQQAAAQDAALVERAREIVTQYGDLGARAKDLDRNNQDLHTQLAQVEQRSLILEDQNYLLRQRLKETSDLLANALQSSQQSEQRLQAIQASTSQRRGATITANRSLPPAITAVTIDGLNVRQDGELVRIELSSDQLFEADGVTLRPGAAVQLDQVAKAILENYPRQVVGIEAHTDGLSHNPAVGQHPHQLTVTQAMAVFNYLGQRYRVLPQQMFILGHGDNFPLEPMTTPAGQARNRRVEVVIYPDPVGSR